MYMYITYMHKHINVYVYMHMYISKVIPAIYTLYYSHRRHWTKYLLQNPVQRHDVRIQPSWKWLFSHSGEIATTIFALWNYNAKSMALLQNSPDFVSWPQNWASRRDKLDKIAAVFALELNLIAD